MGVQMTPQLQLDFSGLPPEPFQTILPSPLLQWATACCGTLKLTVCAWMKKLC
jgi:hypothetical protein